MMKIFRIFRVSNNKYTQRDWDRTVGYGEVPREYQVKLTKKRRFEKRGRQGDSNE